MQRHLRTLDFGAAVERLGAESHWPKAGNALLLEMMRPILAKPSRSPAFQAALDRVAHDRILGRHDKPKARLRRAFDRFRFVSAVLQERRDAAASVPPEDIFDVIASAEGQMSDEALTHLYAAFIFALVGSVGFALGWTVLLAVQHERTDQRSADLVREALRLYPVAWLLERNPRGEQRIAGELVTPDQSIVISTYAIHRNARYWDRPAEFLPERWHGRIDRTAWLPFGAGPQSCIAASLANEIASKLLDRIFERKVSLEPGGGGPSTRAALAPPQFVLHRI